MCADDPPRYDIVIPTIGRASLPVLLDALATQDLPGLVGIVLVDDRPGAVCGDLAAVVPVALRDRVTVLPSGGRGPAAARNVGWRHTTARWVTFLDDDVVPAAHWAADLVADLADADPATGAIQGRLVVPLPGHRRPTDRERNVARLETAAWITADLAVRRSVLRQVGGFDERFPRAYREDTDFHLRAVAAGHHFARGRRHVEHPVSPARWWSSVAAQRGNDDDALLRALHGADAIGGGRRDRHQALTAAFAVAALAGARGRRRLAVVAGTAWLAGTAELTIARLRGASRRPADVAATVVTSVAIPPVATYHWWRGRWRHRGAAALRPAGTSRTSPSIAPLPAPRSPNATDGWPFAAAGSPALG